jgi:hypothetical protein
MQVSLQRCVAAFTAASLFAMPMTAMAQTYQGQVQVQVGPPPPVQIQVQQAPPPPPPDAVAPNGQYVAPMQQQTQQTYVPQSVALSGPRVIKDWQEGEPIPPGYHPQTRVRAGLVAGGATMFAVPYLISLIIAAAGTDICDASYSSCTNGAAPLYIPVIGPFVTMGNTNSATADVFLAIDGLLQAGGVAMFIAGLALPKTVLVRNDLGKVHVMPTPMVGSNMAGLGVVGTF